MKNISKAAVTMLLCLLALSCKEEKRSSALLPNVTGKVGEVLVVIDKPYWEGNTGAVIRETLGGETPYLAQREPLFNLSNVPNANFSSLFQVHRNLLMINVNPALEKGSVIYKSDYWAKTQALVQVSAPDEEGVIALYNESYPVISEFFEQRERDRIIANDKKYGEPKLQEPVIDVTGGVLYFPSGYSLKKWTDNFVWVSDEKQYVMQTVMAYRFRAGKEPFTLENLVEKRDSVMKANVPGMVEGSYMTTSAAVKPEVTSLRYKGRAFMQMRGFWEVYGDYMGGPFVQHAFYSPDGKDIIVVEAFVYAPRYDKRQYLRQAESILYSFEWKKSEK